MKRLVLAAFCAGVTCAPAAQATTADAPSSDVLTFGIVPQQSASRLARMWGPLLAELSTRTGVTFRFRTTKDIPSFEACLAAGAYDMAYMNPMHYTIFAEESAYRAVARQSHKRLKGVIVARKGADLDALEVLDGSQIAFPSPGAFGASILTRATLSDRDIAFEPAYVKSHDSVYRAVAAGLMPAGGGVTRTFNAVDPEIRAQLEVVYETEGFTPHAIAVHDGVGATFSTEIQDALMAIAAEKPELVKGVGMKGFEAAHDADWDDVRALEMTREETGISQAGDAVCPSD
ncbi:phosphate/phosphite/phosphonate ABC transporter substrate-binding protein [Epibacterium ulvae]|uniref:phosphate/phosphite/phosphonate ABC transporter substrate-binding protein n=1 Tax=Epibacterium ulvae TaxID=1156985 RepID=UPI001BFC822B|nr:phosphate/phosphite/phosphonate ABC transporter substrate-binding protein [Epibacterium ulvae]MBT8154814.1 phosphate/phosphite/phosphonate ABC transporter substrate-binding protein [Epibacterium ulvae]